MTTERLFHGGAAGLHPGDLLVPSEPHVADGCPICEARAAGRIYTVGEYRDHLLRLYRQTGQVAVWEVLAALEGARDAQALDPPSLRDAVYLTSSELYATWYAARSCGDLYAVKPLGRVTPSTEDHFPTWTCPRARIVRVVRRAVVLTPEERARLLEEWAEADLVGVP